MIPSPTTVDGNPSLSPESTSQRLPLFVEKTSTALFATMEPLQVNELSLRQVTDTPTSEISVCIYIYVYTYLPEKMSMQRESILVNSIHHFGEVSWKQQAWNGPALVSWLGGSPTKPVPGSCLNTNPPVSDSNQR